MVVLETSDPMPLPAESSPVPNNNNKARERNSGRVDRGEILTQPNPEVDGDQQTASLDVHRLECSPTWIVRLRQNTSSP